MITTTTIVQNVIQKDLSWCAYLPAENKTYYLG